MRSLPTGYNTDLDNGGMIVDFSALLARRLFVGRAIGNALLRVSTEGGNRIARTPHFYTCEHNRNDNDDEDVNYGGTLPASLRSDLRAREQKQHGRVSGSKKKPSARHVGR